MYTVAKTHDTFGSRSFFAKEPLIIGIFCGKWPMEIRHPMTLRHPVLNSLDQLSIDMRVSVMFDNGLGDFWKPIR